MSDIDVDCINNKARVKPYIDKLVQAQAFI